MVQSVLILSRLSVQDGDWDEALDRIVAWRREVGLAGIDTGLELPVWRAGKKGWLADNPPIEDIERLIDRAAQSQCRFDSLRIPVELDQPEKNAGQEISSIDGWTDLAAYADISLVRLILQHPETLEKPYVQKMLQTILDYLAEMEIRVSIQIPSEPPILPQFLSDLLNRPDRPYGLDLPVDPVSLACVRLLGVSPRTLSLSLQNLPVASSVPSLIDRLRSEYGHELEAVVLEWDC